MAILSQLVRKCAWKAVPTPSCFRTNMGPKELGKRHEDGLPRNHMHAPELVGIIFLWTFCHEQRNRKPSYLSYTDSLNRNFVHLCLKTCTKAGCDVKALCQRAYRNYFAKSKLGFREKVRSIPVSPQGAHCQLYRRKTKPASLIRSIHNEEDAITFTYVLR